MDKPSHHSVLRATLLATLVGLSISITTKAGTPWQYRSDNAYTQQFLQRLIQRKLFDVARSHLQQKWNETIRSSPDKLSAWLQLIDIWGELVTQQAIAAGATAADWRGAEQQLSQLATSVEHAVPRAAIRLQQAALLQWQARLAGYKTRTSGDQVQLNEAGRYYREATERLKAERDHIRTLSRQPDLTADLRGYLVRLQHEADFLLASNYQHHAQIYLQGSSDRVHLANLALEYFLGLSKLTGNSELVTESRIQRLECLRLRSDYQAAVQVIANWQSTNPGRNIRRRLDLLRAKILLDQNELDDAIAFATNVIDGAATMDSIASEATLVRLRTYLEKARQQSRRESSAEDTDWHELALRQLALLETSSNAYWTGRAESWLADTGVADDARADFRLLERTAVGLYRQRRFQAAADAFANAGDAATKADLPAEAHRLLRQAAMVYYAQDRYRDAIELLTRACSMDVAASDAAETHLFAVQAAAILAKQDEQYFSLYAELLKDHAERWIGESSIRQVGLWYGRLLLAQAQYERAAAFFQEIPHAYVGPEILSIARQVFQQLVQSERSHSPQTPTMEAAAAAQWFFAVANVAQQSPSLLGSARLQGSRFHLLRRGLGSLSKEQATQLHASLDDLSPTENAFAYALLWLENIAQRDPLAQPREGQSPHVVRGWPSSTVRLTEQALRQALNVGVGPPSVEPVEPLLSEMEIADLGVLILHWINKEKRTADQLRAIQTFWEILRPQENQPSNAMDAEIIATSLAEQGLYQEAIEFWEQLLANQRTNTRENMLRFASHLEQYMPGDERTLRQWRKLVAASPPETSSWFRAKYGIALHYYHQAQYQRALQVIRLLRALHPEMGGELLRKQFTELMEKCEAAVPE